MDKRQANRLSVNLRQLKVTVGGDVVTISSQDLQTFLLNVKELGYSIISEPTDGHFDLAGSNGESLIPHLLDTLKTNGVEVEAVSLKKPTLDDVFLKYTGARIEEGETWTEARKTRRTFRRLTK